MRRAAAVVVALSASFACFASTAPGAPPEPEVPANPLVSNMISAIDRAADPCRDFYRYACGQWLDSTPLPIDEPMWGRGFSEIEQRTAQELRAILDEHAAQPWRAGQRSKLGRFYAACMDEAAIERTGIRPLAPLFETIEKVVDKATLLAAAGTLHRAGVPVLFGFFVDADAKPPGTYLAHLTQGGFGLPGREHYLRADGASKELRDDYARHVARLLELAGTPVDRAPKDAAAVLAFETGLASASRGLTELGDPRTTYNRSDRAGLAQSAPGLPWDEFFRGAGVPDVATVNVMVPEFLAGLAKSVEAAAPETLRAYLRFHVLRAFAGDLPRAFADESFSFFGRRLAGARELPPRWERCVEATGVALGDLLGPVYVERHFAGSKALAQDMIQRVEAALGARVAEARWLDDATRAGAREKLAAIRNKVGYPETWHSYAKLEVRPGEHAANVLAANRFEFDRTVSRHGRPVDRAEWSMAPTAVNAYYSPQANEMGFPAGILQPPFFDARQPMAANFGGIGVIMGHELTHAIGDPGRRYDGKGWLLDWWSKEAAQRFDERAACLEKQYGAYEVRPGLFLDGKLIVGTAIADLGGVKSAFRAWQDFHAANPKAEIAVPGYTPQQVFFLGFAQGWCTLSTSELDRVFATTDPHAPARFRVNGSLSNLPEFAAAFACPAGAPMRRETPCEVW